MHKNTARPSTQLHTEEGMHKNTARPSTQFQTEEDMHKNTARPSPRLHTEEGMHTRKKLDHHYNSISTTLGGMINVSMG